MRKIFLLLLLAFAFIPLSALCQQVADSSGHMSNTLRLFYQSVRENALLYNGVAYVPYEYPAEGHAFFHTDTMRTGSVSYDGIVYRGIPVLYDLYHDLVVINHYSPVFRISLLTERVDSFRVANHQFIRIPPDSLITGQIAPGFYEVLYNRKTMILAKRKKVVQQTITVDKVRRRFLEKDVYYVKLNGKYSLVKNKAAMLHAFSTQKKEIARYLKTNTFRFNSDREASLIEAAKHYDELTPTDEK